MGFFSWDCNLVVFVVIAGIAYLPGGQLVPSDAAHVWELERNHVVRWEPDEIQKCWRRETGLRQWIVWERYGSERHVRCWRIEQAGDVVVKQRGEWRLFVKGQDVTTKVYHHTHTPTDVEIDDRKAWCRAERIPPLRGWQQ